MIKELTHRLAVLLQGKIPARIDMENFDSEGERELGEMLNQLIDFMEEIQQFIIPLSQGKLHDISIQSKNFLASPFKELHSRLLHLTWQATQVANGDYGQRVDFLGDFSEAFNSMIISLDRNENVAQKEDRRA